jgi:hypothetical protein
MYSPLIEKTRGKCFVDAERGRDELSKLTMRAVFAANQVQLTEIVAVGRTTEQLFTRGYVESVADTAYQEKSMMLH